MADNLALQVWKGTTQIGCAEKYCTPVRDPYGQWAWVSLPLLAHGPPARPCSQLSSNRTAFTTSANTSRLVSMPLHA